MGEIESKSKESRESSGLIDIDALRRDATGKWPGIMSSFGIEVGEGRHRPCPLCQGTDRFRFDDKDGKGTYICGQCGAGDGFGLVMKFFNLPFVEAAKKIAEIVGSVPLEKYEPVQKTDPAVALNDLWRSSVQLTGSDAASLYLHSRRLLLTPNDMRYCPSCYESDTKLNIHAMVCLVRDAQGKAATIHRTYLGNNKKADIPSPKKLMPGKAPLPGGAIRLFDAKDNSIGVAEGIETAIACTQLFDIPTWAVISTSIMESFEPPEGIRNITVFGDCDANFAGQKSAYILANKLYLKDYIVDVQIPSKGDWADEIMNDRP